MESNIQFAHHKDIMILNINKCENGGHAILCSPFNLLCYRLGNRTILSNGNTQ
jgi:hypothetical protein